MFEAKAEICQKSVHFLEDLKTPKFHSEMLRRYVIGEVAVTPRHSKEIFARVHLRLEFKATYSNSTLNLNFLLYVQRFFFNFWL